MSDKSSQMYEFRALVEQLTKDRERYRDALELIALGENQLDIPPSRIVHEMVKIARAALEGK